MNQLSKDRWGERYEEHNRAQLAYLHDAITYDEYTVVINKHRIELVYEATKGELDNE